MSGPCMYVVYLVQVLFVLIGIFRMPLFWLVLIHCVQHGMLIVPSIQRSFLLYLALYTLFWQKSALSLTFLLLPRILVIPCPPSINYFCLLTSIVTFGCPSQHSAWIQPWDLPKFRPCNGGCFRYHAGFNHQAQMRQGESLLDSGFSSAACATPMAGKQLPHSLPASGLHALELSVITLCISRHLLKSFLICSTHAFPWIQFEFDTFIAPILTGSHNNLVMMITTRQ